MSRLIQALVATAIMGMVFAVGAQQATDNTQHHPAAASAASPTGRAIPSGGTPMGMSTMPQMQEHMQQHMAAMQAMCVKMAAAQTPAERQALMADHLKAMQDGMGKMMQRMPAAATN